MASNLFKKISFKLGVKLFLFLAFILVILLSVLMFQVINPWFLNRSQVERLKIEWKNFIKSSVVLDKNSADVFINGNRVVFKLKTSKKDAESLNQFAQNLGVEAKVFDELSVELDRASLDKLAQILPLKLLVEVEPRKLIFRDSSLSMLRSGLTTSEYRFATESGKFNLKANNVQDFFLEVVDPKPLMNFATQSGEVHISKKSYGILPILEKMAKINLRVNGKNVEGEVVLK